MKRTYIYIKDRTISELVFFKRKLHCIANFSKRNKGRMNQKLEIGSLEGLGREGKEKFHNRIE